MFGSTPNEGLKPRDRKCSVFDLFSTIITVNAEQCTPWRAEASLSSEASTTRHAPAEHDSSLPFLDRLATSFSPHQCAGRMGAPSGCLLGRQAQGTQRAAETQSKARGQRLGAPLYPRAAADSVALYLMSAMALHRSFIASQRTVQVLLCQKLSG